MVLTRNLGRITRIAMPCAMMFTMSLAAPTTVIPAVGEGIGSPSRNVFAIGGDVTSELTQAAVSGPAVIDTNLATENVRSSLLDLDFRYRPLDSAQVRMVLRFYQDWQSLSPGHGRVAAVRWLSADGNLGNTVGFHAGDFRRRFTPLTLWAPEIALTEEPEIFSRGRMGLMEERFLGGEERPLQGADLRLARSFEWTLDKAELEAIGARIRRAEYLDDEGAQGFGLTPADMDRFFLGVRGEVSFARFFRVGASYQRLDDDRGTYSLFVLGDKARKAAFGNAPVTGTSLNGKDSVISRDLGVQGVHAGIDLGGWLNRPNLILSLSGEYASSSEAKRLAWSFRADTVGGISKNVPVNVPVTGTKGTASILEAQAGMRDSIAGSLLRCAVRYLSNDRGFLNPMAQTPTFTPARILNSENDRGGSALYTTFDALNDGVWRFTPSRKAVGHQQAAYTKNAYNAAVWSPEDLASFRGDPVVQLELPFGLATPNRKGFQGELDADWKRALHVELSAASLAEITDPLPIASAPAAAPTRFNMASAGMRIDWDRLLELVRPLSLEGSYTQREAKRAASSADSVAPVVKVSLWSAGLRYQPFAKWALLAGLQSAKLSLPAPGLDTLLGGAYAVERVMLDAVESQWKVGIEYAFSSQSRLMISQGGISMDLRESNSASSGAGGTSRSSGFFQGLTQLILDVRF